MTTPALHAAADLTHRPEGKVHIYTTESVPGHRITEPLGLVRGNTIRARHVGRDIMAVFSSIVGGELSDYTKLMAEAREQALDRMRAEALLRGANAVVGVRFATQTIMQGSAELLAYGTAVRIEKADVESA